jgi:uncharacterized protein YggU (UPF0235/DUF167 family)
LADGRSVLKVRVRAVASDGEANASLVKLLAQEIGIAPRDVALVGGATARIKRLKVSGAPSQLVSTLEKIAGIR